MTVQRPTNFNHSNALVLWNELSAFGSPAPTDFTQPRLHAIPIDAFQAVTQALRRSRQDYRLAGPLFNPAEFIALQEHPMWPLYLDRFSYDHRGDERLRLGQRLRHPDYGTISLGQAVELEAISSTQEHERGSEMPAQFLVNQSRRGFGFEVGNEMGFSATAEDEIYCLASLVLAVQLRATQQTLVKRLLSYNDLTLPSGLWGLPYGEDYFLWAVNLALSCFDAASTAPREFNLFLNQTHPAQKISRTLDTIRVSYRDNRLALARFDASRQRNEPLQTLSLNDKQRTLPEGMTWSFRLESRPALGENTQLTWPQHTPLTVDWYYNDGIFKVKGEPRNWGIQKLFDGVLSLIDWQLLEYPNLNPDVREYSFMKEFLHQQATGEPSIPAESLYSSAQQLLSKPLN